ncbi:unnamed protein product [Phytomonas sp. EM1]|nr:unnamed protein product [Phytomonas sp. EM1]|eukprot:CCW62922.1 unnamed protein product [Phytomonas sp. isolate EM1]
MKDTSGNGVFVQNISAHKGTRFVNVPSLDKEMLAKQNVILGNNDKQYSIQDASNLREDAMTNLASPNSTAGLLTTENSPSFQAFVHPSNRPIVMAVTKMEQSYMQTRLMLQQCSRNVLLGVLLSLVDEYPTILVEPVRQRLEQLLTNRTGAGGIATGNGRSAQSPNGSTTMWSTPQAIQGGSPMFTAPTPAPTPTPSHRKSRAHRNKEDEQELCSVHHCLRVMKHLQLNHATGLYECVHGFHCLVDGPVETGPTTMTTTNPGIGKETPNSDALTQTTPSLPYTSPTHREGEGGGGHLGFNAPPVMEMMGNGGVGVEPHPFGCTPLMKDFSPTAGTNAPMLMEDQGDGGFPIEEDPALDVHTLANLLKSVRAMEKDE